GVGAWRQRLGHFDQTLYLVGADVGVAVHRAFPGRATLVVGFLARVFAFVDRGTGSGDRHRLGRSAVVCKRGKLGIVGKRVAWHGAALRRLDQVVRAA